MTKKELLSSIEKSIDLLDKMDQTIEVRGARKQGVVFASFVRSIDEKIFKEEVKEEVKKEVKNNKKEK